MERKTEDKNKQTHLKKNVSTKVNDAMKQTNRSKRNEYNWAYTKT